MARKTDIAVKKEMEVFFRFRMECLNRHPDYAEDYKEMEKFADEMDRLANDITEGVEYSDYCQEDMEEDYDQIVQNYSSLLRKYNLRHPAPKPNDPNGWRTLQESNTAVVLESGESI